MTNYFAIFVFVMLCLIGGIVVTILAILISPAKKNKSLAKYSAYECGMPTFGDARMQFNVHYYRIAIFFIIFDVEMVFFFPWAVVVRHISLAGLIGMGIFLGLLALGLIYEWKKGALEWD